VASATWFFTKILARHIARAGGSLSRSLSNLAFFCRCAHSFRSHECIGPSPKSVLLIGRFTTRKALDAFFYNDEDYLSGLSKENRQGEETVVIVSETKPFELVFSENTAEIKVRFHVQTLNAHAQMA
jgi:hypothetical protein